MAFDKNIILSHIPEFYLEEKTSEDIIINDDNENENIELVYPNTVNLSANLMDKVNSELPVFNTWGKLDDYIQEFKLSEIFNDSELYSVKQTELLKGFFLFKGTNIDIQYVMKIAGYDLEIIEDGECQLSSKVYIDLDRPDFEGFRASETIKKIRSVLDNRMSVCVYLNAIELNLVTKTFFNVADKVQDKVYTDIDTATDSDFKQLVISSQNGEVVNNKTPKKAYSRKIVGNRVYIPVRDETTIEIDRSLGCDSNNWVSDTIYKLKVVNKSPIKVNVGPNSPKLCSTPKIQGISSKIFPRFYDYRVNNIKPIKVDNKEPYISEGRLIKLDEVYSYEADTDYSSFIGGDKYQKVHNTNPIKIRNSVKERQVIEDRAITLHTDKLFITDYEKAKTQENFFMAYDKRTEDFLDNTRLYVDNETPMKLSNNFKVGDNKGKKLFEDKFDNEITKSLEDTYFMGEYSYGTIVDNKTKKKVVNIKWKDLITVQGSNVENYAPANEIHLNNINGWEVTNTDFRLAGNSLEELQELFPKAQYTIEYTSKTKIMDVLDNKTKYVVNNTGWLKVRGKSLTQISDMSLLMDIEMGISSDEIKPQMKDSFQQVTKFNPIKVINNVNDKVKVSGTYMGTVYSDSSNLLTSYAEDIIGGAFTTVDNRGTKLNNKTPNSVRGSKSKMEYLEDNLNTDVNYSPVDTFHLGLIDYKLKANGLKLTNNKDPYYKQVVQGANIVPYYPNKVITLNNADGVELDNKGFVLAGFKLEDLSLSSTEIPLIDYNESTKILPFLDNKTSYKVKSEGLKVAGKKLDSISDLSLTMDIDMSLPYDLVDMELRDNLNQVNNINPLKASNAKDREGKIYATGNYAVKIYPAINNLLVSNSVDYIGGLTSVNNVNKMKVNHPFKVKGDSSNDYSFEDSNNHYDKETFTFLQHSFKQYAKKVDKTKINNKFVIKVQGKETRVYPINKIYRVGDILLVNNKEPLAVKGRLVAEGELFEYTANTSIPVSVDNLIANKVSNSYPMKSAGVKEGHRSNEDSLLIQAHSTYTPYFRLKIGKQVMDARRGYIGSVKVDNSKKMVDFEAVV